MFLGMDLIQQIVRYKNVHLLMGHKVFALSKSEQLVVFPVGHLLLRLQLLTHSVLLLLPILLPFTILLLSLQSWPHHRCLAHSLLLLVWSSLHILYELIHPRHPNDISKQTHHQQLPFLFLLCHDKLHVNKHQVIQTLRYRQIGWLPAENVVNFYLLLIQN